MNSKRAIIPDEFMRCAIAFLLSCLSIVSQRVSDELEMLTVMSENAVLNILRDVQEQCFIFTVRNT